MKKCNTELMKELKEVQMLINFEQKREDETCVITYYENDKTDQLTNDYEYEATRRGLDELQGEERKIKKLLAISNATTKVVGYEMTIAEALVYLAQLSQNKAHLTKMAARQKLSRDSSYRGYTEFTKVMYDLKKAQDDLSECNREIAKLQMAIDRTNLTNMIEV